MALCDICPRGCGADRAARAGYCRSGEGLEIASICRHRGEEPALSGRRGICNVFFAHCNLRCVFCQNHQISRNESPAGGMALEAAVRAIVDELDAGATHVGFVSPSHMIPQMKRVIAAVRETGRAPVVVMNTNSYDRCETIASLEGLVDVYLPDFKYLDERLARELSDAPDYPAVALAALREMHRQKGSNLAMREDGTAASGLIIRHLVLPGQVANSVDVLRAIAEELSTSVHLSLMSQYYPPEAAAGRPPLDRTLAEDEYETVRAEMERLGFHRGWIQEWGSAIAYQPDFTRPHPFE